MSYLQFFEEVNGVTAALSDLAKRITPPPSAINMDEESATAIWQAIDLLQRATQVLAPLIALDVSKSFLRLPDVTEVPDADDQA